MEWLQKLLLGTTLSEVKAEVRKVENKLEAARKAHNVECASYKKEIEQKSREFDLQQNLKEQIKEQANSRVAEVKAELAKVKRDSKLEIKNVNFELNVARSVVVDRDDEIKGLKAKVEELNADVQMLESELESSDDVIANLNDMLNPPKDKPEVKVKVAKATAVGDKPKVVKGKGKKAK